MLLARVWPFFRDWSRPTITTDAKKPVEGDNGDVDVPSVEEVASEPSNDLPVIFETYFPIEQLPDEALAVIFAQLDIKTPSRDTARRRSSCVWWTLEDSIISLGT